jgi:hypothetical protein
MTEKEIREKIRRLQNINKNNLAFWNDAEQIWEINHQLEQLFQKLKKKGETHAARNI